MQENYIKQHVLTIPELILEYGTLTLENVRKRVPLSVLKDVEHIIITGCGYSHAAGMNAKYIFEGIAGVSTENLFSVDVSRHKQTGILPPGEKTMVIGISNSGIVARIQECLQRYRKLGAYTVAFTQDEQTKCAKAAGCVISTAAPALASSLPLRSYIITLLNCYGLAWNIARAKGMADHLAVEHFYQELCSVAGDMGRQMGEIAECTGTYAKRTALCNAYEFVGSGMGYASAWLGKQLMAGQTGKLGIDCSLEDWLHSDFFLSQPEQIATILYLPSNSGALSRLMEVKGYMEYLKRPLCIVTDAAMEETAGVDRIVVPYSRCEYLNPLVDLIPTALYAGEICELIGEEYSRGFREQWDFSKDGKATEFSAIEIIP